MAAARIALAALLVVLGIAAAAFAGPATTNTDGDVLVLSVGVTPPVAGTARAPQGVGLSLDAFAGNRIFANSAIPTDSITFTLAGGFTENGLRFPACTLTPNTISPCPRASQIGSGTAESELLNPGGQAPTFTPAQVTVYNGQPQTPGGVPTLAFIVRAGGRVTGELDFAVRPIGRRLTISQILLQSAGPGIGITKVSLSIPDRHIRVQAGGKTTTVHFLTAPTVCRGSWDFGLTTTSAGRKPLTATDRQTCTKH